MVGLNEQAMDASTPKFDTAIIRHLRSLDKQIPAFLGIEIPKYVIVVDANVVVRDLLHRIKYPSRINTALQELVISTIFELRAPRWLDMDIQSAIQQIASKGKITERQLVDEWTNYRSAIIWDETLTGPIAIPGGAIDPKDTPYIALETKLGAHGILTSDRHIEIMGGHPLSREFVMSARELARALAKSGSVRLGGVTTALIAFKIVTEITNCVVKTVTKLPPTLKLLGVLIVIAALLHPPFRRRVDEILANCGIVAAKLLADITLALVAAAESERAAQLKAASHLIEVTRAVRKTKQETDKPTIASMNRARNQKGAASSRRRPARTH